MTPTTRPIRKDTAALTLIALFAVLTGLVACGGGGDATPADPGQATFERVCATCHGKDANGLPKLGKGLRNNEFTKSQSDAELIEFLKIGRPATHPLNTTGVDMPPNGGDPALTAEDLQHVVNFMRTL